MRSANADVIQQFTRTLHGGALFGTRRGIARQCTPDAGARTQMAADHDVFQRAHVGEQADILEGARDTGLRQQVRFAAGVALSGELESTAVELVQASDDVEQRGLARTVGADESVYLALLMCSETLGQRNHAAEVFADIRKFEQSVIRCSHNAIKPKFLSQARRARKIAAPHMAYM